MLKLVDNPPILYPPATSLTDIPGRWWVAHTKARNEKVFAFDLIANEIPYFLPLIRRTIFSGGRRRTSLVPLFGSYVFLAGEEGNRQVALATNRLCSVIAVDDQAQLIEELSTIERLIASGVQIDPAPTIIVGKRVRIARGPFRGVIGRVIRKDNVLRIVVSVSILGRGAEMEIDSDVLEALE